MSNLFLFFDAGAIYCFGSEMIGELCKEKKFNNKNRGMEERNRNLRLRTFSKKQEMKNHQKNKKK
jgi:hypothetical protein